MGYILYARKSCESEDRQVQSIDDQINKLKDLSRELGLKINKIYTEAKSAKKPNNRPIFEKMLKEIEAGEAEGILCWQINRLSRNPIDSARVQWLLQQKILKAIQTIDRQYLPDDNVLLFNVESGMANQYIIDLKKNVERGMESKAHKGWYPYLAPLGYLNDKINHTIIKDPQRFNLIRKAWDMMVTGNYTPPRILDIATNKWGLRTRKFKRVLDGHLSRSSFYDILTNLFYAGYFKYRGQTYKGNHEPMITLKEFDRVQDLLGSKGKPRPQKHEFPFTGIIRCGECGCLITAETKKKHIKSTGEIRRYTYYHCTRQKKGYRCHQPSIRVEDLEQQIDRELEQITILPEFRDWALGALHESNEREIEDRNKIYEARHKALTKAQAQIDNLIRMRCRNMLTDEEYTEERETLKSEIARLRENLRLTENRADDWVKMAEKIFNFAANARKRFIDGDFDAKKEILRTMGTEFILKGKKLSIKPQECLQVIKKNYPPLEKEYLTLEPVNIGLDKAKTEALTSVRTKWRATVDDVRTKIMQTGLVYVPSFS